MNEPEWEDIQAITSIIKKLPDDEAALIILTLCNWAKNYGFSKGILDVLKIQKGQDK